MRKTLFFKEIFLLSFIMLFNLSWALGQIIISQYIETNTGTKPKGIEVWNVSAFTIDFSVKNLEVYKGTNGAEPTLDVKISTGSIASGDVMVISTYEDVTESGTGFQDYVEANGAVYYNKQFTFNGDDALVLYLNGIICDIFGDPGTGDPGTGWSNNGVQTYNQNISLKSGIVTGDADGWTDPSERFEVTTTDNTLTGFGLSPERVSLNWTGTTNSDWNTITNWGTGIIPSPVHDVSISSGNTPTISSSTAANCYNLTLEGTATLTIASDASRSGSLIFGGAYSGSSTAVTYQRYITGTDWHIAGSPFTGQTINNAFLTANSISGMKDYDENADNWNTDYTITDPNAAFSLGKGYAIKRSSSNVINLTGALNNTSVAVSLTRANYGWNLLSNPFSSAINATLTAHATNNLITANADVLDPSYAALYIWDQASTSYKIINNAGNGSLVQNYLQVGQGFFVKSKTGGGTFNITPALQSHQTTVLFKSKEETAWASIILNAETSNMQAKTQILFGKNMHRGLDVGYDAGLFNNTPNFLLYSRLLEDNGVNFGLQCLPVDFENLVIPIGLNAKAGNIIMFSATSLNIPEEYALVLEDKTETAFTDLTNEGAKYSIQLSEDSKGIGRFFIHTSFKSAIGIGALNTQNTFQIFSQTNNNQLIIRRNVHSTTRARIYTITGKLLAVVPLNQSSENLVPFNEESGIYIMQISNEFGTQTEKFAWIK